MSASLIAEAAKAASLLLSMRKDVTPEDYKSWFLVIVSTMETEAERSADSFFARKAQTDHMDPDEMYRLVQNEPATTYTGPPHDELVYDESPPTEDTMLMNPFAMDEGRPFS